MQHTGTCRRYVLVGLFLAAIVAGGSTVQAVASPRLFLPLVQNPPWPTPTPQPTATPFPTATPTATVTPVPTATPPIPGLQILPNDRYRIHELQGDDLLVVRGEVWNNTEQSASLPHFDLLIYTSGGNRLDTVTKYLTVNLLHPGERTCFGIGYRIPANYSHYEFGNLRAWPSDERRPQLSAAGALIGHDGLRGYVYGAVRNNGTVRVHYHGVQVTVYDADGRIYACESPSLPASYIDPGVVHSWGLAFPAATPRDMWGYNTNAYGIVP
jgi:hypothetical protein